MLFLQKLLEKQTKKTIRKREWETKWRSKHYKNIERSAWPKSNNKALSNEPWNQISNLAHWRKPNRFGWDWLVSLSNCFKSVDDAVELKSKCFLN